MKTESFDLAIYAEGNPDADRLALVLPGKLDTKDYAHMVSHVRYLAGRGYYAVSFDPPGTWGSGGEISLYTMTAYGRAVDELIAHYGRRPTLLVGHSRGATMALIMSTDPVVSGYVSIMPAFSPAGFGQTDDLQWQRAGVKTYWRELPPGTGPASERFDLPYGFFADQLRYRVTDAMRDCPKPKLFVYGTRDPIAAPERVKALYAYMAGPKELSALESDHDYRYRDDLIGGVNRVIGEFVTAYRL
jgi:pimeloyl-ACP methyl ester carboxylesterase